MKNTELKNRRIRKTLQGLSERCSGGIT